MSVQWCNENIKVIIVGYNRGCGVRLKGHDYMTEGTDSLDCDSPYRSYLSLDDPLVEPRLVCWLLKRVRATVSLDIRLKISEYVARHVEAAHALNTDRAIVHSVYYVASVVRLEDHIYVKHVPFSAIVGALDHQFLYDQNMYSMPGGVSLVLEAITYSLEQGDRAAERLERVEIGAADLVAARSALDRSNDSDSNELLKVWCFLKRSALMDASDAPKQDA